MEEEKNGLSVPEEPPPKPPEMTTTARTDHHDVGQASSKEQVDLLMDEETRYVGERGDVSLDSSEKTSPVTDLCMRHMYTLQQLGYRFPTNYYYACTSLLIVLRAVLASSGGDGRGGTRNSSRHRSRSISLSATASRELNNNACPRLTRSIICSPLERTRE